MVLASNIACGAMAADRFLQRPLPVAMLMFN
jgi:hypothetical protein